MAIIFDADILHSGAIINNNKRRHCIQFKIIHKDDIQKLPKLLKYHVLIDKKNDIRYFSLENKDEYIFF